MVLSRVELNWQISVGLLMWVGGTILVLASFLAGSVLGLIGIPIFTYGCIRLARTKGYSGYIGLLSLAPIAGLIVLVLLPERNLSRPRKLLNVVLIVTTTIFVLSGAFYTYKFIQDFKSKINRGQVFINLSGQSVEDQTADWEVFETQDFRIKYPPGPEFGPLYSPNEETKVFGVTFVGQKGNSGEGLVKHVKALSIRRKLDGYSFRITQNLANKASASDFATGYWRRDAREYNKEMSNRKVSALILVKTKVGEGYSYTTDLISPKGGIQSSAKYTYLLNEEFLYEIEQNHTGEEPEIDDYEKFTNLMFSTFEFVN